MTPTAARSPVPDRRTTSRPAARTAALLGGLVAASLVLRTRGIDAGFWIDEGLSVGIASHGLAEIPAILRQDGSPPLYYMLLHVWMQAFGGGEVATHALSLVFSLATIPAAWWAGRSLIGARTAWICAVLAAVNPYLTYYGQETRMYSLVVLLSLLAATTFAHAFILRRRRFVPVFALILAALVYTHNWALFLGLGAGVALLVAAWRSSDRRDLLRDGLLGFGGAAVLYSPWIPSLIWQAEHTGAPWARAPTPGDVGSGVISILGGDTAAALLVIVAGAGLAMLVLLRHRPATEPGAPSPAERRAGTALAAILAVTAASLFLAWASSQFEPAWANRYFAVVLGPLLLLVAGGLAGAGRLGIVAAVLVAVLWFDPLTGSIHNKSNARAVADDVRDRIGWGDLVISTHPERVAELSYYLPAGLRYATPLGPVDDPRVMDWQAALPRLKIAASNASIDALLSGEPTGRRIVLVQPIIRSASWNAPWTDLVRRRSAQWGRIIDAHPRLEREATVPSSGYDESLPRGVRAKVYTVLSLETAERRARAGTTG